MVFFFFSSRRRHTRCSRDWSSDVCSSDLWRFNVEQRGGHWDLVDGAFRGTENAEHNHPATASIGFDFKDVVIACQVRLHDVPLAGRKSRGFSIRTTDTKDYVCSVMLNPSGMRIQKDDNDHAGPETAVPLGQLKTPIA